MFTPPEMWTTKENELEGSFRGYIWPKRFVADTQLHFTGNGRKQEQKFFPLMDTAQRTYNYIGVILIYQVVRGNRKRNVTGQLNKTSMHRVPLRDHNFKAPKSICRKITK